MTSAKAVRILDLTDQRCFTGAADLAEVLVLRHGLDYRFAYRVVGQGLCVFVP